jgi:hypothetical protein
LPKKESLHWTYGLLLHSSGYFGEYSYGVGTLRSVDEDGVRQGHELTEQWCILQFLLGHDGGALGEDPTKICGVSENIQPALRDRRVLSPLKRTQDIYHSLMIANDYGWLRFEVFLAFDRKSDAAGSPNEG